jgi:hypothetical protein
MHMHAWIMWTPRGSQNHKIAASKPMDRKSPTCTRIHTCTDMHTYIHQKQCLIHGVNISGARWASSTSSFQLVNTSASTHPLPLPVLRLVAVYMDATPEDDLGSIPSDAAAPRDMRSERVRANKLEPASASAVQQKQVASSTHVDPTIGATHVDPTIGATHVEATIGAGVGYVASTGTDAVQTHGYHDDVGGYVAGGVQDARREETRNHGQMADRDGVGASKENPRARIDDVGDSHREDGGYEDTSSDESEFEADEESDGFMEEGSDEFDNELRGRYDDNDEYGGSKDEQETSESEYGRQGKRHDSERQQSLAEGSSSDKRRNGADVRGNDGVSVPLYQTIHRTSTYICNLQLDSSVKV